MQEQTANWREGAYWLAALNAAGPARAAAKRVLYQWCVQFGRAAFALGSADANIISEAGINLSDLECVGSLLNDVPACEAELAAHEVSLLTRAATAYPEALTQRLPEAQLPYLLYYLGNLELLDLPALALTGPSSPSAGDAFIVDLVRAVAHSESVLVSGYSQGSERRAAETALAAGGSAILILPLGLCANARLETELHPHVAGGRLLVLSPYRCAEPYSAAHASARLPLIAGLCDLLVAAEPDAPPDSWLSTLIPPLPQLAYYAGSGCLAAPAWEARGAVHVANSAQAAALWLHMLEGAGCPSDSLPLETDRNGDAPIAFRDAESAIATLSQSGTVPEVLARRLRERASDWQS